MTFLYHTYPEDSGKGKSTCHFTLGNVYSVMAGGQKNGNLTNESLDEQNLNQTSIEELLKRVQSRARGKTTNPKTWLFLINVQPYSRAIVKAS